MHVYMNTLENIKYFSTEVVHIYSYVYIYLQERAKTRQEKEVALTGPLCSVVIMISRASLPIPLTPTRRGQQYFRDEEEIGPELGSGDSK